MSRPGVARLALEAIEMAPIIGRGEPWAAFRRRQDEWLRGRYADAVRLLGKETKR